jgi:hypothetical protein
VVQASKSPHSRQGFLQIGFVKILQSSSSPFEVTYPNSHSRRNGT